MRTKNARIRPTDAPRVEQFAEALRQQRGGEWHTADVVHEAFNALALIMKNPMAATTGLTSTPRQEGISV